MHDRQGQGCVRFGPFVLDLESGLLRTGSTELRLSDQPLALLIALLERPGTLVSREDLRGRLWPDGTFVDFEHGLNSAVSRLREALGDSAGDPSFVETIPRRGYRLLVPVVPDASSRATEEKEPPAVVAESAVNTLSESGQPTTLVANPRQPGSWRWRRPRIGISLVLLIGVASAIFFLVRSSRSESEPLRFFTVTAFPGYEGQAVISPDGQRVVFGRTGSDVSGPKDLWIRDVEGDAIKQLTDTSDQDEIGAVWSPDGRKIAFMSLDAKHPGSKPGIFVMSVLDGHKTKVAEGGLPAWTPDGRSLVLADRLPDGAQGMFQHILGTGERRQLTWPSAEFSEAYPTVSPDGTTLAFMRAYRRTRKVAVFVAPMSGGEPQRKTDWRDAVGGLTWTPGGRELLYSSEDESGSRMYRISAFGSEPGRLIRDLPLTASTATASRARSDGTFRLSFVHGFADVGLRLIDMQAAGVNGIIGPPARFCDSARIDTPGRFSRDGTHVAFASNRSGRPQVWVATRDESGLRSVTTMEAASLNVGSWSNDSRAIAFDAVVNGNADIYVVTVDGGVPHQLTHAASSESDPEWSADGRWISYVSDASGRSEIWRVPAGGGHATRITSSGGFEPRETSDGRTLYYMDQVRRLEGLSRTATLKQVPAAGGEEQVVLSGVTPGTWDITDRGIVFLEPSLSARSTDALAFYDFADRRVHKLGPLGFTLARFKTPRIAVSRDGRWVLANHLDAWERDIMVVDNFR